MRQAEEEEVLGWSEEEEEEEEEESEEEEEEEFKLPPGLQRQLLGSNNEEPEKNQTGIYTNFTRSTIVVLQTTILLSLAHSPSVRML